MKGQFSADMIFLIGNANVYLVTFWHFDLLFADMWGSAICVYQLFLVCCHEGNGYHANYAASGSNSSMLGILHWKYGILLNVDVCKM